ncbi:hypothetical protein [Faunimonas pinastri]|uniref:hypothetical protein n=1 Tax=Faunimonas pinastri TaxID=1855383 RepID=UPI0015A5768A|nr:hypothetical protein [Faunimonas pinastri]
MRAAEHIAVTAAQLSRMARAQHLPLVSYLAEMVVLEAWREASREEEVARG